MESRIVKATYSYSNIDGLIPGVRGQRAFPTPMFRDSDPFLMLDHIGPQKVGANFRLNGDGHDHPHGGFETITFMFEGGMDHRDSLGNRATLESGSVQRMNAGSGIIHGGDMKSDPGTERFHEMQLWVNNPAEEKMSEPEIHNVSDSQIPSLKEGNLNLRVVAGQLNGIEGPIKTKATTHIGHLISSENGGELEVNGLKESDRVMVYVLEGSLWVGDHKLSEFDLAELSFGETIDIRTEGYAQALILAGTPLNESVVFGGPFVMNSEEEIQQAYEDYNSGRFGSISLGKSA